MKLWDALKEWMMWCRWVQRDPVRWKKRRAVLRRSENYERIVGVVWTYEGFEIFVLAGKREGGWEVFSAMWEDGDEHPNEMTRELVGLRR